MRIGVISDSHGSQFALRRAVAAVGPVAMWLHAGDYSQDAARLAALTGLAVTTVAGNCDGRTDAKIDEFVTVGGRTIWLTHGHRYQAKERSEELVWWGRQYGADVVVYGHSHIPDISREDGILLFNPGAASRPRAGFAASCGLLVIAGGEVRAEIIEI
jgi:putative phosphoesterase